jgi:hypothetical protein
MAIKATTLREDHVSKRETPLGRWFPVILYAVNLALWIAAGIGEKCGICFGLWSWHFLYWVFICGPLGGMDDAGLHPPARGRDGLCRGRA